MEKNYLNIANNKLFFVYGLIIVIFIFIQSVLFIRIAWKRGIALGLTKKQMMTGLRSGMISAIIPSIPIVITLIAMSPVLGIYIPWIRLSVIGSGPYELLAAGIGAKSMGVSGLGGEGFTSIVFANSVWIMTIGSLWSALMVLLFLKVINKNYKKIEQKDPKLMSIISSAAFFGVIGIFFSEPITTGGISLITLIGGACLMVICALLIQKYKLSRLKEFALSISMIGAMVCAGIFS